MELEGVEPSSKQGNHTLSTRLFRPSVFELQQDPDHQLQPYPLKFHHAREATHDYFRFNRTALPKRFGTTAFEQCLVLSPCDWIKPIIYYTSIRQRERNYFRQINFRPLRFRSQQTTLRVLTYHSNPLSNPVNPSLSHEPKLRVIFAKIVLSVIICKFIAIFSIIRVLQIFFSNYLCYLCNKIDFLGLYRETIFFRR